MAWLGEELPEKDQDGRTPFAPRCMKDLVEERLFGCSPIDATCSPASTSWTPPACTSKVPAAGHSVATATAKTIGRIFAK